MTARSSDKRPTLTLKGDEFTPEFRSLLNKAAKKAGKTQAAFAAEALAEAARRVLTGAPIEPAEVPVKPADLLSMQQMIEERFGLMKEQMAAELRAEVQAAMKEAQKTEAQTKGLLSRILGR